jgi:hypothetical protein
MTKMRSGATSVFFLKADISEADQNVRSGLEVDIGAKADFRRADVRLGHKRYMVAMSAECLLFAPKQTLVRVIGMPVE